MEAEDASIKTLPHNAMLRFFMGYKYDLKEVTMRFNTFYSWMKKSNLDMVKLEEYPELHNQKPFVYLGESKTKYPIILFTTKKFFPASVPENDLVKYIGKFIFDVLDK